MADFFQWKGDASLGIGYIGLPKGSVISIVTATLTAALTGDTTYTGSATITGFNSILLELTTSSAGLTSKVGITGALSSGGTYVDIIDKDTSAGMTATFTANKTVKFSGLPDYLGFTATLSAGMTAGSSATVKIVPFNL